MNAGAGAARDVVLMTCHDIGRHLHCYGVETVSSPRLDAMAESGVIFTNAFATAPQCSPSRASLATGLYPHNNGVMGLAHAGFDWEISAAVPHAAAIFRDLGFEAHLFGNQHVSLHPERLGFHELHAPGQEHGSATGMTVASALERFLDGHRSEARLYLEINFDDTHRPYPTESGMEGGDWPVIPPYLPAGPEAAVEMRAAQSAIAAMDAAAGRVLDALDRAGRADRALVVFTTDHGLPMPRAKCTLYDPGIEVALMMRLGAVAQPATRSELVCNIDVLPTLIEAVGGTPPAHLQGRSLLPLLRGEPLEPRSEVFAEKTFHSYYDPMRCIRTGTHKYIRNFETAFAVEVPGDVQQGAVFRSDPGRYSTDRPNVVELYDLEADPLEQRNIAGSVPTREVERDLGERLWRWMTETDDPLLRGPVSSPRYQLAMER
jgi:N-sulfoglucosamine sulfohydrolase